MNGAGEVQGLGIRDKGSAMPHAGFEFEMIFKDVHLMQVRIVAWNGAFGGVADVYVGLDALKELSQKLRGFPSHVSDVREVNLGAFGPECAGGAVSMKFYCADASGHALVDAKVESDHDARGMAQAATLSLAIEATGIDEFVTELGRLAAGKVSIARLKGLPRGSV